MKHKLIQWYIEKRSKIFDDYKKDFFSGIKGPILELGAGYGVNFVWYPKQSIVTVIEPNVKVHSILEEQAQKYDIDLTILSEGSDIELLQDQSFATVVDTLVLCSVPNVSRTLRHINRVLQPGGTYRSIEHVKSSKVVTRELQLITNPAWQKITGCSCLRQIDKAIKQAGFTSIRDSYFKLQFTWVPWTNNMYICKATK